MFAVSGIIMNHRKLLSSSDVNRKYLPESYRYSNWNLASVRGANLIGGETMLVYGNIGIWRTDTTFQSFTDFNKGFPHGIDNRKIAAICADSITGLHAATLFGLYRYDSLSQNWNKVSLPVPEERVVSILPKGDSLLVMTRSNLLISTTANGLDNFTVTPVPAAEDDDDKVGLFKTLWVIHSGEIYGIPGKLIVDAIGITFIILCITGLIYFFVPYRLARLKDEIRKIRLKRFNRSTLKWHNSLGSWTILILILTIVTGMFLRPPLLIPIANSRVTKIKYSELDSSNPWFDRFRDLLYDQEKHRWMVATSEGIYYSDDDFSSNLKRYRIQPPVSIMGINVFEQMDKEKFLVGSFSGIFLWEPERDKIWDYFTKMSYSPAGGAGPPFGNLSVAGYIQNPASTIQDPVSREVLFDYSGGAIELKGGKWFPSMPEEVKRESPISLWNTALEIHTGRIYQPILGEFYILVVPVVGLFALEISIIGFLAWWITRKRKKRIATSLFNE